MKGTPYSLEPLYDANGNLVNDERNRYTWDADIHLLSVSTRSAGDSPAPESTTHFRYDALHRRVARLDHEGTLTRFVHDGWNVIEERTTNPKSKIQNLKSHTWGHDISGKPQGAGGIGGLLSTWNTENGTRSNFHYDSNGNVVLLTDTEGNESARYAYDAFGKTMLATGPMAEGNKYRFSTKPVEEPSGLCYYGYRYYSPELGRWLSKDPINERGGINLFVAVNNNVVNAVDVLGLDEFSDCMEDCGRANLIHLAGCVAVVGVTCTLATHFPAASPWIISVGADATIACFAAAEALYASCILSCAIFQEPPPWVPEGPIFL
jgi:RHS repeat-associated protein